MLSYDIEIYFHSIKDGFSISLHPGVCSCVFMSQFVAMSLATESLCQSDRREGKKMGEKNCNPLSLHVWCLTFLLYNIFLQILPVERYSIKVEISWRRIFKWIKLFMFMFCFVATHHLVKIFWYLFKTQENLPAPPFLSEDNRRFEIYKIFDKQGFSNDINDWIGIYFVHFYFSLHI